MDKKRKPKNKKPKLKELNPRHKADFGRLIKKASKHNPKE